MQHHTVSGIKAITDTEYVTATELDSHADSPVVGKYCKVLERTGRRATVSGFTTDLGKPLSVPVVNAAVAYDCKYTGKTYIMTICNALYFENMEVNLVPPFMMRLTGIEVDECPKFLAKVPSDHHHSMYFPEEDIRIPFQLEGIISYIPTRAPTNDELTNEEGHYLLLTPNLPVWDPHTADYKDQEHAMLDYNGHVRDSKRARTSASAISTINHGPIDHMDQQQLVASVKFLGETVSAVNSVHRKGRVDASKLSQRLNIPYEMAKKTIQATTQLAVRTVQEPSLTHKFSTNDRMLRYPRLANERSVHQRTKMASSMELSARILFLTPPYMT